MTSRIVLEPKNAAETVSIVFDFASQLTGSETVSSATVTAAVYSGSDSSPSSVISGSATASGTKVTQKVTAGTLGVTYVLTCTAVTSTSQTLTMIGYLVIIPATQ